MRIDLRLERLHLGSRRELRLSVELVGGELRGEQRPQPLGDGELRAIDVQVAPVVKLDRADGLLLHEQRDDDAKDMPVTTTPNREAPHVLALLVDGDERLHALALQDLERGLGVLGPRNEGGVDRTLEGKHL